MTFTMGNLEFRPAISQPDLLAAPVAAALTDPSWTIPAEDVGVVAIDPELADTGWRGRGWSRRRWVRWRSACA